MVKDNSIFKAISFLYPLVLLHCKGEHGQQLEIRLENGKKVLNSANSNYSFGSLHKVWKKALSQVTIRPGSRILVLGGGVGSIPHLIEKEIRTIAHLDLVENDSKVIELGITHFGLDKYDNTKVFHQDAFEYVRSSSEKYDLILIDLFNDLDLTNGIEAGPFWDDLDRILEINGRVLINTIIHDDKSRLRVENLKRSLSVRYPQFTEMVFFEINHVLSAGQGRSRS